MHTDRAGFTLVEVMVALATVSICAAIAVPAMDALTRWQQMQTATNRLMANIAMARVAAITRNRPVVSCPSSDAHTCTNGTDWSRGWISFYDADGNRQLDRKEDLLQIEQPERASALTIRSSTGRTLIRFLPNGTSAGTNLTFQICAADQQLIAKVVLNNAGRPRIERHDGSRQCIP